MPLDVVLVKFKLIPESIVAEEGDKVTVGSALTVTVTEFDDVAVFLRESVTIEDTTYCPGRVNVIAFPFIE